MFSWLVLAILAYFFLAIVSLFDRYFLVGPMPNPKVYTFNAGLVWFIASLFIIPLGVFLPEPGYLLVALASGVFRIFAILFLMEGIIRSEVSRIVPANAGLLPIFTFLFFLFYLPPAETLKPLQIFAFFLLVVGSVLISLKKLSTFFSFKIFKFPIASAFLFALSFFLVKITFEAMGFWNGFFWSLIGSFIGALVFLFFHKVRQEIFSQKPISKNFGLFVVGQAVGGIGVILQYYAINLAGAGQVPLINALEGVRHAFLLLFIFGLSLWRPNLLKEEIRGAILIQKILAVLLICGGLIILTF